MEKGTIQTKGLDNSRHISRYPPSCFNSSKWAKYRKIGNLCFFVYLSAKNICKYIVEKLLWNRLRLNIFTLLWLKTINYYYLPIRLQTVHGIRAYTTDGRRAYMVDNGRNHFRILHIWQSMFPSMTVNSLIFAQRLFRSGASGLTLSAEKWIVKRMIIQISV